MGTYVTETGLKRKTLQEVRAELEQSFKEVFGTDFETSVDSPNGLLISQLALAFGNLWDLAFEVFTSRDPGEATGVSLDFAAALNGLNRREATACNGTAVLYTLENSEVTIPSGSLSQRSRGKLNFSLDEDVTIDPASCDRLLTMGLPGTRTTSSTLPSPLATLRLDGKLGTPEQLRKLWQRLSTPLGATQALRTAASA